MKKLLLPFILALYSTVVVAQDGDKKIDVNINTKADNWYASPWVWVAIEMLRTEFTSASVASRFSFICTPARSASSADGRTAGGPRPAAGVAGSGWRRLTAVHRLGGIG